MQPRTLPSNLDAEAAILGGVYLRRGCLDLAAVAALEVEDFYSPKHQATFTAIRNLEATAKPIDPVTVDAELQRIGKSEAVGGLAFQASLALHVPSEHNVEEYARIVAGLAVRRRLISTCADVVDRLYHPDGDDLDGEAGKSYAISALEAVSVASASSCRPISEIVIERMRALHRLASDREAGRAALTGVPTGIAELDRAIGGYQPGIVTTIGARPAMGKSSMLLAALDAATAAGLGAHAFLLEDSDEAQADRAIARDSRVPAQSIRRFELTRSDLAEISASVQRLRTRNQWHVEERAPRDVHALIRAVRREKRRLGTRLVVVDYVQLVAGSASRKYRAADRHLELDEVMTAMMRAAKEDGIAYVVASQLNRALESRADKRPTLGDLRESGSIEERSKCVLFPYRGAEYGPPVKGVDEINGELPDPDREWPTLLEVGIAKNSNGQTGRVIAHWDGPTMRVS